MTSLSNDPHWLAAKNFLKTHFQPADRIIAPAKYRRELPNSSGYDLTSDRTAEEFEWVLVHKGLTPQINGQFLQRTIAALQPVFANEVFVVFTSREELGADWEQMQPHLKPLLQKVAPERAIQLGASGRSGRLNRLGQFLKRAAGTPSQVNELSSQISLLRSQVNRLDGQLKQLQRQQKRLNFSTEKLSQLSMVELQNICRAACHTAYLGSDTVLCRVLSRYLLYGDSQDVGIVPHLCLNGYWEGANTLAMARLLRSGDCCIDVGANAGYFTVLMAGAVGQSGRVAAIEPNPKLVDLLRKTLEVNGFQPFTAVLSKAVADVSGKTVQLAVPQGHVGNGTIVGQITPEDTVYKTETITIDQITQDWERVDLIKIDAEGAEEQIWRGMGQTIRRYRDVKIVLEFGSSRYADPKAFLQEIQSEGFKLYSVDNGGELEPLSVDRCLSERLDRHWDLFLIRDSSRTES